MQQTACRECGNSFDGGSQFCPFCGCRVDEEPVSAQAHRESHSAERTAPAGDVGAGTPATASRADYAGSSRSEYGWDRTDGHDRSDRYDQDPDGRGYRSPPGYRAPHPPLRLGVAVALAAGACAALFTLPTLSMAFTGDSAPASQIILIVLLLPVITIAVLAAVTCRQLLPVRRTGPQPADAVTLSEIGLGIALFALVYAALELLTALANVTG